MEILDVVDDNNVVIGEMGRHEINKRRVSHRIVHVMVLNKDNKLLLQKRSAKKSFCPLYWSTSAGGHVQKGETYECAAAREFEEELGVKVPIKFLFQTKYKDPRNFFMFIEVFSAKCDDGFKIVPADVESIAFFSKEELRVMIKRGDKFHPELKFLLETYEDKIFSG